MNNFDNTIKEIMKKEVKKPLSYRYAIKNALESDRKEGKYIFLKKIATATVCLAMGCSCVFAVSYIYENVWKEPVKYESFEERVKADVIEEDKEKGEVKKEVAVDKLTIVDEANRIIKALDLENDVTENEIQIPAERNDYYFYIEKNNLKLVFSIDGVLKQFTNDINNFEFEEDRLSDTKATEISDNIINIIGQKDNYILGKIEEGESYFEGKSRKEWMARYYQEFDGLKNEYNTIAIDFFMVNGEINISKIITNANNYKYDNNEMVIDKKSAMEIAKEYDRKIALLDIESIDSELSIKPINSFVYAQLNSLGEDDEFIIENQENGDNVIYDAYDNEKTLRKVWNVKIKYVIEKEKYRNYQEFWGRNYFVDATTGEVIGGSWGE